MLQSENTMIEMFRNTEVLNVVESKDTHSLWLGVIITVGDQVSWANPKNLKGFCFMPPSFIRLYIVRSEPTLIISIVMRNTLAL